MSEAKENGNVEHEEEQERQSAAARHEKADDAQHEYSDKLGNFEFKLEGLSNGYRVTVKGDEEKIRKNRQAVGALINFGRQADKAGWWLPWPLRFLLKFWSKYK